MLKQLESLHEKTLFFQILKQIAGFGLTGVVSLSANIAVAAILSDGFGVPVELAYLGGYSTALLANFIICRHLIFKATERSKFGQFVFFLVSSLCFRGVEYSASLFLHNVFATHYLWALLYVAIFAFLFKFIYYRNTVFRANI